jgi:hypothetical protein
MRVTISRSGYPDFELVGRTSLEDELRTCGELVRDTDQERRECGIRAVETIVYEVGDGYGGRTGDLYLAPRCRRHAEAARERVREEKIGYLTIGMPA